MQNFFALLSGLVLGPVWGAASAGLYLLAGLLGAPVFAGFTGGITRFAGPTGGFLIGYPLCAFTAGLIAGRRDSDSGNSKTQTARIIAAVIAGLLVVYIPGVLWLKKAAELSREKALIAGFVPFIPGDIFKGIAAVLVAGRLRKTVSGHLYE